MSCPACKNTLESREYESLVLATCLVCEGVWFDFEELNKGLDTRTADKLMQEHFGNKSFWQRRREVKKITGDRLCPRDQSKLHRVNLRKVRNLNLVVDSCPTCYGVWMDDGELYRYAQHTVISRGSDNFLWRAVTQFKDYLATQSGKH